MSFTETPQLYIHTAHGALYTSDSTKLKWLKHGNCAFEIPTHTARVIDNTTAPGDQETAIKPVKTVNILPNV